jgi:hypothetical protein
MKRSLYQDLLRWKQSEHRKPLILQGARQVGKTWLMKAFGANEFERVAYFNFESSERLRRIFSADFDLPRILASLEIEANMRIHAASTLLIFDEIQEAEKGLTALKCFHEQAPEFAVIAAGSLLGVSLQKNHSFPVGKVDLLQMYPMSFAEFLENTGETLLHEHLAAQNWQVIEPFHDKLIDWLRHYYFIGGMPEAVSHYLQHRDLDAVRAIQRKILTGYENDFAKHAPIDIVPRLRLVWNSIISQLAKENRKYVYGQVRKGARAKDFETAIHWLADAGLVLKANLVGKPALPLHAYADFDNFKLFLLDVGLLNAMAKVDKTVLLEKNSILTEFKGAMTEQFVAQQLKPRHDIFYWSAPNATAEIDFLLQSRDRVIPLEVKAEENLKAKSLRLFAEKFQIPNAVRSSMSRYREQDWMVNWPLYAVGFL